ncbi:MAG: RNA methyltransferase [Alphaproteobacteria bacterium]|nr:RNA methyltransferase [Alphaproteobacteria bacterium]
MRGYFGIGVEGISKEQNIGTIARSAHSFGASFFFTIAPAVDVPAFRASDTSDAFDHVPYHQYASVDALELPHKCSLVAVELVENSIELPSFRHPTRAAYVLGPEMGSVSPELMEKCDHVIKIPMKFCVNVGVAGALVMYDRLLSMGKFAPRPVRAGGPTEALPPKQTSLRRKVRNPEKYA